jgi:hypothetical protein
MEGLTGGAMQITAGLYRSSLSYAALLYAIRTLRDIHDCAHPLAEYVNTAHTVRKIA